MRTIQEYLKECDREEVINNYIYRYAFSSNLIDEKLKDVTFGEYISRYKEKLDKYIDRLCSLSPKMDEEETWILMTIHVAETEGDEIRHILVKQSDVMDESLDWITPYGYELSPQEESVGYYVADTYLTQYYISDLIVDFLYETSFTGYEQEGLQEVLDSLDESKKEIEEGTAKLVPFEEVLEGLKEKHGYVPEKKDEKQKEAWKEWFKHTAEYSRTCEQIEIKKLREILKGERLLTTYMEKRIELNENGNNAAITVHILPEAEMRKIGFTDSNPEKWFFCKMLPGEITFNVTINKNDPNDWRIDILDEDFMQPYDYQRMLETGTTNGFVKTIAKKVEHWMAYLADKKVIEGHEEGDYI